MLDGDEPDSGGGEEVEGVHEGRADDAEGRVHAVRHHRLHEGLREPLPKEQPQVGERRLQKGEASAAAFLSRNQSKSMDWTLERESAIFEPEPKT